MAPLIVNCCISIVRWTPVVFITAVIVWSYYAYVVEMCLFTVENIAEKVLYLILYHPIIFVFLWAYWKTIFTHPGSVPKDFFLSIQDRERFQKAENEETQKDILEKQGRRLPVQCRTSAGTYRFCEKCYCIKPDRAHHCSVCGSCVLKMDHHCPWVNNCVNFSNYKYFVLFLGYGLIYCIFVSAISAQYFIKFWTASDKDMSNLHIVFLFFAGIMFSISLVSLFGYHLYLTSVNRSTLESFRAPIFRSGPDKDGFSLGRQGNYQEVFGDNCSKWFLPVFSSLGDGVTYPTRMAHEDVVNYHSTDDTKQEAATVVNEGHNSVQPSFGDGVNFPVRTVDEDYDTLLGERQRWMEEGESDSHGFVNQGLTTRM